MKLKGLFFAVALAGVVGLFAAQAEAAATWHTVTINRCGQGWGYVYLEVTDTVSLVKRWVIGPTDATQLNRMLAVALTAMSGGLEAMAYYDSTVDYSEIVAFYIISP